MTSSDPADASDGVFDLGLADSAGHGLSVTVWDETDGLDAATIASLDGDFSVGDDEVDVVNIDDDSLRVTWADPPIPGRARLSIRLADDGRYQFRLERERPQAPTEEAILDRVLVPDFHVAVPAADVKVELIDTLANGD